MTKLKITVTEEIFEQTAYCSAGPSAGTNCAISVAIRDVFPKAFVADRKIFVYGVRTNAATFIELPKEIQKFIFRFDNSTPLQRIKMEPISFEIEVPDKVIKKINILEIRALLNNHPTLKLVN